MKRYDAIVPRPGKDGKTFWHRVGAAFERDGKTSVKLDSIPLPNKEGEVWITLAEPRQKEAAPAQDTGNLNDDMPW